MTKIGERARPSGTLAAAIDIIYIETKREITTMFCCRKIFDSTIHCCVKLQSQTSLLQ
jgi:hypothetical protein